MCGFILVNTVYYFFNTINNFFEGQKTQIHRGDIFSAFDPGCYYED